MPNKESHLAVANRNQDLIDQLLIAGNSHPEWLAVVAFYKALHIVDADLFISHPEKHGGDHNNRHRILKTTRKYENIYRHYRPMYSASLVGRYLETDNKQYPSFANYLSAADVVSIILNHHLAQLQKSAEKIIGAIARLAPSAPPPPSVGS